MRFSRFSHASILSKLYIDLAFQVATTEQSRNVPQIRLHFKIMKTANFIVQFLSSSPELRDRWHCEIISPLIIGLALSLISISSICKVHDVSIIFHASVVLHTLSTDL